MQGYLSCAYSHQNSKLSSKGTIFHFKEASGTADILEIKLRVGFFLSKNVNLSHLFETVMHFRWSDKTKSLLLDGG